MSAQHHRRWYWLQALLLGLPALVAGGGLGAVVVFTFFTRRQYMGASEGAVLLMWSVAGLLGLAAWLWLSAAYLRGGRERLRRVPAVAWFGLALGMLAALGVALFIGHAALTGGSWPVLGYLVVGPPLLIPSAHLAWLARPPRRQEQT
ncbi:hypothetical protein [Stenotrophomonas sp.]|uniref:hypothetical protein n=1 Tax=Stenotrophomonas sp. TaxID=69392 RepID=UPI002FC9B89F